MAQQQQQVDFAGRIVAAASQGAVGAFVGASLSAVTEPVVNRVLVNRIALTDAIAELKIENIKKFFETTVATNFIKFPFFEVVNVIMASVKVSPELRGIVTGGVFTTATLPITNYRYMKSMGKEVEFSKLYQAYLPTVGRDIIYGMVRNKVSAIMMSNYPDINKTNAGRFINMFVTIAAACVLSAPGNEFRGYVLQAPEKKLPFNVFFQPSKFLRSTTVGGIIMSSALGCGAVMTPKVQDLWAKLQDYCARNELSYLIIVLFFIHQYVKKREEAIKADKK